LWRGSSGRPPDGGTYVDLVLGLVASWVGNPAPRVSARLAPPVTEIVQRGRIIDRHVEDVAWLSGEYVAVEYERALGAPPSGSTSPSSGRLYRTANGDHTKK
jgi:hypothetical protein